MKKLLFSCACAALLSTSFVTNPALADDPQALVDNGKFFGEVRYRYESVEQDGITNDAKANTVRTNIGFKSGTYNGFQGLAEAQIVQGLGDAEYNDRENGNTGFPVVADPDVQQINRLWVSFSGLPQTTIKAGRQFINLDNQRFVGTVGWRQNDQTFDGIVVTNNSIENLKFTYGYIDNVNRIFDGDTPPDDLDSTSHLVNASYMFGDWLTATAYGYWLDFDNADTLSSRTLGLRATGKVALNDNWSFIYEAEGATQEDHGDNTASYDEDYYHIAPGITGHGLTLKVGHEVLGSDGTNAFQTPLATGHKFNGWADKFLTTPATTGLEDTYVSAAYKFSGTDSLLDGTKVLAVYHEFEGEESGDLGDELNLAVSRSFTLPDAGQPFNKLNVLVKYADYEAEDGPNTDTEKLWVQFGVKF